MGTPMPKRRFLSMLAKLHALLGSDQEGEANAARAKLLTLLAEHGKTWNDIPSLLAEHHSGQTSAQDAGPFHEGQIGNPSEALDSVHSLVNQFAAVKEHEAIAFALWVLHTYVFHRFMVTPRLMLTSPVRECGKTTLLSIAKALSAQPLSADYITAAAVYRRIEASRCTLLLDEADNLSLVRDSKLKAVFNSGHRKGGSVALAEGNFSTFAPMMVAAIGTLPLPFMSRSIVIAMARSTRKDFRRFDAATSADDFDKTASNIRAWAGLHADTITPDPPMPLQLRNRYADNWRPLIAIADTFGEVWGTAARDAAIEFSHHYKDEDPAVTLLKDIRHVFDARHTDRLASATLAGSLVELDSAPWSEWRGVNDDQQPRALTASALAQVLKPFRIRPRTIWPPNRLVATKSAKGYFRSQFHAAWRAYCPGDTPAQESEIRHLRSA